MKRTGMQDVLHRVADAHSGYAIEERLKEPAS
jgi:hypothetical protein